MRAYFSNTRTLALLAALYSLLALGAALTMQYGFGLHPCELCMLQRYPYVAAALVGFVTYYALKSPRALTLGVALCALLFAVDAGVAFYHAGVELGFFPGPAGCTNPSTGEQTLEEMRAAIMNAALVPCDQAMGHFLGLSIAAWNGIAALFIALFITMMLLSIHRKSHVTA